VRLARSAAHDGCSRTLSLSSARFIAPPWPDIFTQDEERKQTLDEAERTYEVLARTYADAGYELVELPRVSVAERARFVQDRRAA
jgi:predicted ATPase